MSEWPNPVILTDDQIDAIADRAAKKVFDQFAMTVGWKVIKGASYIVGVGVLALSVWLSAHGWFK